MKVTEFRRKGPSCADVLHTALAECGDMREVFIVALPTKDAEVNGPFMYGTMMTPSDLAALAVLVHGHAFMTLTGMVEHECDDGGGV